MSPMQSIEKQVRDFNVKTLEIMCDYKIPEMQTKKLKVLCNDYSHLLDYSNVKPKIKKFIKKYIN